ncbi:MAG: hypothetical protein RLZZ622_336, partial [Planctomycetota bacterium]
SDLCDKPRLADPPGVLPASPDVPSDQVRREEVKCRRRPTRSFGIWLGGGMASGSATLSTNSADVEEGVAGGFCCEAQQSSQLCLIGLVERYEDNRILHHLGVEQLIANYL